MTWFDGVPTWALLLGTTAVVLVSLEIGVRVGRRRIARGGEKVEALGPLLGATMGLLAFMLAFTVSGASTRDDARKALVIDEANAIETTWLRAGLLPQPQRAEARSKLGEYVEVRLKGALGELELRDAMHRSERLLGDVWTIAMDVAERVPGCGIALFIRSLNELIDLNLKRLTVASRLRVPSALWLTLYVLLSAGMLMAGAYVAQGGARNVVMELNVAFCFSLVVFLIADLDRPQEGLMNVSQQAMKELDARLNVH